MHPLERYLRDLREIRATGAAVPETSYYSALSNLFNEVGASLLPRVRCVINVRNRGAGLPDGGLFTADQLSENEEVIGGQLPSRGVIEVKPSCEDAWMIADGEQVTRYWGAYGQVLVTNLRDFLLIGRNPDGSSAKLESFRLAETEAGFWRSTANPRLAVQSAGGLFIDYLKRVMLHDVDISSPEDVAWFLAAYARHARRRIQRAGGAELTSLTSIRDAFEAALGVRFTEEDRQHFFISSAYSDEADHDSGLMPIGIPA